ncbi:class I SAM-dependent methyltransferase [Dethiosulfatarculus sandiegensis]|nr:class I SAM-dependent methyltransferase [Dethiosulfatarculus sandiegensis]
MKPNLSSAKPLTSESHIEPKLMVVPVERIHKVLGYSQEIAYPGASLNTPLDKWNMEKDDSPIFRYLYSNHRPKRHLEFGTWQGQGVVYCLEESEATVWTINLPFGEKKEQDRAAYSYNREQIPQIQKWLERIGIIPKAVQSTDSVGFIGRLYLEAGLGNRVNQIYCDSREWDHSAFQPGFFDSALIDGSHKAEVVISDTQKAFELVRPGGLIMWHDFCPPVMEKFEVVKGVTSALVNNWEFLNQEVSPLFWINPSWILAGIRK